jgi:hypothetical protein
MGTNAIINAAMQQLVDTVSDEVIRKLKAEGMATVSLEAETLEPLLIDLLNRNMEIRESIRDITSDLIDNINLSDNSEFSDLEAQVSRLDEKLDELDATPVDADNDDFQDAVRSVIRNHI